jgi:hypothetical protein
VDGARFDRRRTRHADLRPAHNALWPTIAVTLTGSIATWVTNDNGGGSGKPTAALYSQD